MTLFSTTQFNLDEKKLRQLLWQCENNRTHIYEHEFRHICVRSFPADSKKNRKKTVKSLNVKLYQVGV